MDSATEFNKEYYGQLTAGRESYWMLMPAPRMRIDRVLAAIQQAKPTPRHICDFGCGNGALLSAIEADFPTPQLSGVDLSGEQITRNQQDRPAMTWAAADLTADDYQYPFDQTCDVAVSSEVIEHLGRPQEYLKNIHQSLEADGLFVLTTQSGPVHTTERHVGHVRHWEADAMTEGLEAAGFCNVQVGNCGYPFHNLSKWAANLRPQAVMQSFGEQEWGSLQKFTAATLRVLFRFNSSARGYQLVATARK